MSDLLSNAEVAELLGVTGERVMQLRADPEQGFPEPVEGGTRPGWRRTDIEEWADSQEWPWL